MKKLFFTVFLRFYLSVHWWVCRMLRILKIDGSTTVLPIAQKGAEVFMKKNPSVKVFVSGSGSGTGIKALTGRHNEYCNSSREAKEKEMTAAKEKNVILTAIRVALDGIVPVVHPSMKINDITTEQLRDIYNGKIKSWKELGGPDRPISAVSRDTSSGTYEVWEEKILKGDKVKPDALLVASNGQAVQTVAQNKFAIGYIGIGYIDKSLSKSLRSMARLLLQRLCVTAHGLLHARSSCIRMESLRRTIAKFIDFMLSKDGQKVVNEVKYVSIK